MDLIAETLDLELLGPRARHQPRAGRPGLPRDEIVENLIEKLVGRR